MSREGEQFERLVSLMARLRAPDGCPWDRRQTFDSIRAYTLEETYEVLEAIGERDWAGLEEELGDLLLQVLFYAQMASEEGFFSIGAVLEGLAEKLIRRHPHVFEDGMGQRMGAEEALGRWEAVKAEEKQARAAAGAATGSNGEAGAEEPALLGSIPRGLPAMLEAVKIGKRAASTGFDWENAEQVLAKLEEEIAELRHEIRTQAATSRLEDELGDVLFTVVNVARVLHLEPESALKHANGKFRRRFAGMEAGAREQGRRLTDLSLEEMEQLWQEAKRRM